jgi:hypothetical protein
VPLELDYDMPYFRVMLHGEGIDFLFEETAQVAGFYTT